MRNRRNRRDRAESLKEQSKIIHNRENNKLAQKWELWLFVFTIGFLLMVCILYWPANQLAAPDATCRITKKEAFNSSMTRAKTQSCRDMIKATACRSRDLYPKWLPNTCPRETGSLGCFQDSFSPRLLSGYLFNFENENSVNKCLGACLSLGFRLAGVQNGNECFCGDQEPRSELKISMGRCDMVCPGNKLQTCGGHLSMKVFRTDVIPPPPST